MKRISLRFFAIATLLVFAFPTTPSAIATDASQQITNHRPSLPPPLAQPTAAETDSWVIECVDCPPQLGGMSDRSLKLDADGYAHIAYGKDRLHYAVFDGEAWQFETIDDTSNTGGYASLVLDSTGYPHVSYQDASTSQVKYAYKDISGWHSQTVNNISNVGAYTSLALDQNDFPHISYTVEDDQGYDRLKYAYKDASG